MCVPGFVSLGPDLIVCGCSCLCNVLMLPLLAKCPAPVAWQL